MTIEQIKEEAKKRFDKDLTDEQAQALLEKGSELTDEALEAVAGGLSRSEEGAEAVIGALLYGRRKYYEGK